MYKTTQLSFTTVYDPAFEGRIESGQSIWSRYFSKLTIAIPFNCVINFFFQNFENSLNFFTKNKTNIKMQYPAIFPFSNLFSLETIDIFSHPTTKEE